MFLGYMAVSTLSNIAGFTGIIADYGQRTRPFVEGFATTAHRQFAVWACRADNPVKPVGFAALSFITRSGRVMRLDSLKGELHGSRPD